MIAQLNTKLKSIEENLEDTNKCEKSISVLIAIDFVSVLIVKEAELKRRVGDMETMLGYLVRVNGEGRVIATVDKMTSIQLSVSFQLATLSFPFSLDQLSCQLTDPNSQHVECSITSTEPGMATVSYTPTLRGAHQLKISVGDTDIPGSPFTVHVRPSLEMRSVPINTLNKFTGLENPRGVAVSESGEVVVSEYNGNCISVFNREGNKMRKFGSEGSSKGQFNYPHGVAITTDNYILIADSYNHRIQMFTMEGEFVRLVGEKGHGPLQFNRPAGIAVHPSGLVFIVDKYNHRIQVLHPDLSLSHMFGSGGTGPGQFDFPSGVACDSSGIVYVTDCDNHRVQLFSADGQFISTFGSKGSQPGKLYYPRGICIDSTDTVYVTDYNRVSAFSRHGQFLECFGGAEEEIFYFDGIAEDKSTGNLHVCDCFQNRVVVY